MVCAVGGSVLLAGYGAVLAASHADQFPPEVRATGIGVPYALAVAVFGGTAPFIAASLIAEGLSAWIPLGVVIATLISGITGIFIRSGLQTKERTHSTATVQQDAP
jgi:MHS family alpha-ketoglutarate permease-like MFS transporter